ncbi:ATP synthase F1 subunit gamma [Metamycoplasma hyosynoviae]|uniref:ATP synthase F1 subunit gamma n=1 Tax=Metamycoplasma hyosynoviae TaxID=29559 RepID=UPI002358B851|nr:ATP synthase F1 subunit gamma [Metamycoplasma hyosynoviae]MDC8914245.1 ATP synthase F1 subunit gamma [Metamycoplasma hyosynoviae]
MSNLQEIKNRIYSISTTQKITKAMELISTSKFSKIKKNMQKVEDYYENIKNIFFNLLQYSKPGIDILLNEKLTWKFEKKRKLYIVFGSDLGLCGAFNFNLLKKINEEVTKNDIMIVVGSKLLNMLAKRPDTHIIQSLIKIGDDPNYEVAKEIAFRIYEVLQISDLESIKVIYTKYLNPVKLEPIVKEIYPISFDESPKTNAFLDDKSFEPSADTIIKDSFSMFFEASIYYVLYNSKLSEMSMRRLAMEQATDNAIDLIDNLKIKYNQTRQAKITQEITEIVSGSNSKTKQGV